MIKKRLRLYLPILVLLFLGVFLLRGLWLDPKKLPSALIGKPAPAVVLPVLSFTGPEAGAVQIADIQTLQNIDDLQGQPWVLNVFASWCQACLVEHPHFIELAKQKNQTGGLGLQRRFGQHPPLACAIRQPLRFDSGRPARPVRH